MPGFEVKSDQEFGYPYKMPGGFARCRCPNCGYQMEHRRDLPCNQIHCPRCGSIMVGN